MANITRLADTSAWHRSDHPSVEPNWRKHLEAGLIATTDPLRLEILYSARNAEEYDLQVAELDALRQLPCTSDAMTRALEVQRTLAHRRALHHRISVPDLMIAAVAELNGAVLWHYDADYDRIAEVTGQPTEWIAARGTL